MFGSIVSNVIKLKVFLHCKTTASTAGAVGCKALLAILCVDTAIALGVLLQARGTHSPAGFALIFAAVSA